MLLFRYAIVMGAVWLQAPLQGQALARPRAAQQPVAEPPVPADPLELVASAQPVEDASQRAEIINVLVSAHRNSNVRAQVYDLKTTFTVSLSGSSTGSWQEEDISPGAGLYRWTVEGPGYSAVNLNAHQIFYSSQPVNSLPLRILEVRDAIFNKDASVGPRASIRTANTSLNGVPLVCALVAHGGPPATTTGGRRWEEEEYCVDPKAGALVTQSPAPGLYVLYDHSSALRFHGKLIPNKFTITQAGQTVVEAQTESVSDPANTPALFEPAGLNQIGAGPIMSAPWRFRLMQPAPNGTASGTEQIVALHGLQSPDGRIHDTELLASSDASLNQGALAIAAQWTGGPMGQETKPGATPQSHEVFLTIRYFAPGQ